MNLKCVLILLIFYNIGYVQTNNSKGNLIHLDVTLNSIDYSDTLGTWENGVDDIYSVYYDVIATDSSTFLLKNTDILHEQSIGSHTREIENAQTGKRQDFSYFSAVDYVGLLDLQPNIYKIKNGIWLFDDVFGNGFLSNNATLYKTDISAGSHIYHVCGEIDTLQLIMWNDRYDVKYFIVNLSDAPAIDTLKGKRLNITSQNTIIHLEKYDGNYYFLQREEDLDLCVFEADSFRYVKTVLSNKRFQDFIFRDNKLYARDGGTLFKYDLSLADTIFNNETQLLGGDIDINYLFDYAVEIDSGELRLFNIQNESIEKVWELESSNGYFKPIINYPDIYIHNTTTITSIVEGEQYVVPSNAFLLAYPNPFNSSVKFRFKNIISEASLKIYTITGSLVEQIDLSYTDRLIWRPHNIASGIYIVKLRYGKEIVFGKIHYLK
jgi:hypothetical protein